jgi:hypothetical protein
MYQCQKFSVDRMVLRSELIQKWWPTTQSLDLVEGSVESVAAVAHDEICRFLKGEAIATSWEVFPDLDAAFRTAAEFCTVPTVFLVLPTHSKWTVLWNNCLLCDGYDSLCYCLTRNHGLTTVHWSAHDDWTSFQSGASFTHRRIVGGNISERSVQVAQEDNRWEFFASGVPLPEEDVEGYAARRKRDRLNEEKMSEFLSRLGATPWLEKFYAVSTTPVFVLHRNHPPSTISASSRSPGDVLGR